MSRQEQGFLALALVAVLSGLTGYVVGLAGKGAVPQGSHGLMSGPAAPSTPPACIAEPGFLPPKDGSLLYNLRRLPNDEEIAASVQQAMNWFQTGEMYFARAQPERGAWYFTGASAAMLRLMLCAGGTR